MQRQPIAVLVCPHESYRTQLRRAVEAEGARVAAVYERYPGYAGVAQLLEASGDAYIVDLDSDQEVALELVEAICTRKPACTVMVYSAVHDVDRMVACMRVGAREFLSGAITPAQLRDALLRAASRHADFEAQKATGRTIVFWSAKGGSGASTLAANFAIALRAETSQPVLLADLHPQLGDLSVLLGVTPRFTVADALKSAERLDAEFLSTVITEHKSGVSLIAAPNEFSPALPVDERAVGRLLDLARNQYPWVVVDAGPGLGLGVNPLWELANVIYLVMQLDIPSLHNTQRCMSYMREAGYKGIEVVVNRYDARRAEFDSERVAKALGGPPKWKVPNDYAAVHRAANTGHALIYENSPVAESLRAMARSACGKPAERGRKKASWNLFG